MRLAKIAITTCLCLAAFGASASAQSSEEQRQRVYPRLERIADAAARLETTYCRTDLARGFEGALDGINGMAERNEETPLHMETPGIEAFADIYGDLLEHSENGDAIERAAINGLVRAYDPTGSWYTWADVPRSPRPGGIVVTLEREGETARIVAVGPGGPAEQAGILPGDRLLEIDDQPVAGLDLAHIVSRLQGDIGSYIMVVVDRDGGRIEFAMQRIRNVVRPASWRVEGSIGIVDIDAFQENSANGVRDAIRAIRNEARDPSGYILDLRGNGGGLLDQVIESADYFIDGGVVTTIAAVSHCTQDIAGTYNARRRDETRGAPLVVLIDHSTASGAELVAAALRDRRNATLIGERSFGNARVHTVIPMQGGHDGFLKLNTGMLTSPSGSTWEQTGLTPDIVTGPRTRETDPAMDRAIALLAGTP